MDILILGLQFSLFSVLFGSAVACEVQPWGTAVNGFPFFYPEQEASNDPASVTLPGAHCPLFRMHEGMGEEKKAKEERRQEKKEDKAPINRCPRKGKGNTGNILCPRSKC